MSRTPPFTQSGRTLPSSVRYSPAPSSSTTLRSEHRSSADRPSSPDSQPSGAPRDDAPSPASNSPASNSPASRSSASKPSASNAAREASSDSGAPPRPSGSVTHFSGAWEDDAKAEVSRAILAAERLIVHRNAFPVPTFGSQWVCVADEVLNRTYFLAHRLGATNVLRGTSVQELKDAICAFALEN